MPTLNGNGDFLGRFALPGLVVSLCWTGARGLPSCCVFADPAFVGPAKDAAEAARRIEKQILFRLERDWTDEVAVDDLVALLGSLNDDECRSYLSSLLK